MIEISKLLKRSRLLVPEQYTNISNETGGTFIQYRAYNTGIDLAALPCPVGVRHVDMPRYVVRSEMLDILRHPLDPDQLHTGKKLVGIDRVSSAYILHFDDGTRVETDIVVGADGIHSRCRHLLQSWLGLAPDRPVYSGKAVYRALVPREVLSPVAQKALLRSDSGAVTHRGPHRHMMSYPIGRGLRLLNVVCYVPAPDYDGSEAWTAKGLVADLTKELDGWCQPVQECLEACASISPECFKQALHYRSPLETYVYVVPSLPFYAS